MILVTPGAAREVPLAAARMSAYVTVDPTNPDVYEHLRNAAAGIDQRAFLGLLTATVETPRFASVRRALLAGVLATLLLIGASLLVTMVEQLRERRRLLAVLVAFGARRRTLAWSVLWQTAVPVVLGMVLAIIVGVALGVILLAMVDQAVRVDWAGIAGISGAGVAVVLLVTVLSMPALWRMMRPNGLRTE
jgi:predicted lysophospholipase L1 biosynthesis ABC-type transport system permease subunit